MSYIVIDKKEWKILEMASFKKNLSIKGLIVDTRHLDRCSPAKLSTLYKGITKHPAQKSIHGIIGELSTILEKAGKKVVIDSDEERPVAKVRHICETMRGQPRKMVIEACVNAGVNSNTAHTQYQKWFKENTQ